MIGERPLIPCVTSALTSWSGDIPVVAASISSCRRGGLSRHFRVIYILEGHPGFTWSEVHKHMSQPAGYISYTECTSVPYRQVPPIHASYQVAITFLSIVLGYLPDLRTFRSVGRKRQHMQTECVAFFNEGEVFPVQAHTVTSFRAAYQVGVDISAPGG
jgi:hypothetical protein